MPIYEFKCEKCNTGFEQLVMSQQEQVACPQCSAKQVSRLMSHFSKGGNSDSIGSLSGGMGGGGCAGCSGGNCASCF